MIVATTAGKVEGIEKEGILQYRGIPFARAERFEAPQPPDGWDGVRGCNTFSPVAPQSPSQLEEMLGARRAVSSESDCLALNVFTPGVDGSRPVMLWIHGGGFQAGTGATPWYNGSRLATAGDVVVVTINYRLGPFGFLHLEGLLDDDRFAGSANNGIRDQIAALEWVRDNIAGFGGDPSNVTIFGESAGGMSVGTLMGTPSATGLFHKAIPQSGAASHAMKSEDAAGIARRLLERLGIPEEDAERLLTTEVDDLLNAQKELISAADVGGGAVMPFTPVVDGVVLPQPPLVAVKGGMANGVPVLIGTTAEEFNLFALMDRARGGIDDERLAKRANRLFGGLADGALHVYREARPGASAQDVWCAIATDWMFRIPAVRLAEAQVGAGGGVWSYLFSYRSRVEGSTLGACHAIEIPFVFDNVDRRGVDMLLGPVSEDTRTLSRATSGAWLRFARDGAPGDDLLPEWPRYETSARAVMNLDVNPSLLDDPGAAEREVWARVDG